ncbi:MAG TPA: lysine-sensitive aspartokinase 3 [Gemmatimonadales bacterium]|nr:lysine-sensitive aspartokinase 3 [Gemmatimonadales bacterium]
MIVCKFGGTSVQDAPAIRRLIGIVRSRSPEQPVVVVSALARMTDGLLELAKLVELGGSRWRDHLRALIRRHEQTAHQLDGGAAALDAIRAEADALRAELEPAAGRRLLPRELDAVSARGELWSSRLVAAALEGAGIAARWVDVRPIMVTDDRYGRATPYTHVLNTRARDTLRPLLAGGMVPVTQGFIGATAAGVTTTFGRGGSDFTAALLGAALRVRRVEIWTDVDGLMTADPRVVASARTLAVASYEEAAELATFGARVLHPATAVPLVREGIPIIVLNAQRPDHPGTTIESSAELERLGDSPIRSISWKKGITVLNVRAPRMLGAYGFLRQLFEVFERHEVVVDVLASSEVSVSLTIEDRSHLGLVRRELEELGDVWVDEGRAIVAVVGIGLKSAPGLAARVFGAVKPTCVEVISQGASAINMTFIVKEDDGPDVVRRLHREFFGTC